MLFKKIILSSALISMAGIVACGDDSSSNGGGSKELPKSVPTFMDLGDIECNADRKCEKIVVEESNDTYQCDGVMQWNKLLEGFPSTVCPTEENKGNEVIDNTEGSEGDVVGSSDSNVEGNVIGSSDSNVEGDFVASSDSGDSTESSSSSEENVVISSSSESGPKAMVSCDNISEEGQQRLGTMGEKCTEFEAGSMAASALELRCEDYGGTLGTGCPAKSEEDIGSSSSAEVTGPTGDLVSCVIEFMGGKTCDEVSKAEEAAFTADCNMVGGTMNTAGGCNAAEYAAKCVCEGVNHYDSSCEGVICRN